MKHKKNLVKISSRPDSNNGRISSVVFEFERFHFLLIAVGQDLVVFNNVYPRLIWLDYVTHQSETTVEVGKSAEKIEYEIGSDRNVL